VLEAFERDGRTMLNTKPLTDPCGRFLPGLVVHDLHDRMRGRSHRANARWGRLQRPAASGRLLWIVSGESGASVRLGVELTRALVARRLDISCLFTYEAEHPDLLAPLARCPRTAWGYGPADYVGAMHTVRRRLLPFGIVLAGIAPRPNLAALCAASRHALLVAPPLSVAGGFERIYPTPAAPCASAASAPAADLDVLMYRPRGKPETADAVIGAGARRLWCWHGDDPHFAKRLAALLRGHLPDDLLLVSGAACSPLALEPQGVLRMSEWARVPVESGTLLLADEPDWLQVLLPGMAGVHFATIDPDALWQALAAGAVASAATATQFANPRLDSAMLRADDENELIATWTRLSAAPELLVQASQTARAAHAAESRLAANNAAELIERVCRWQ
jgi:hypothetical protein